MSQLEFYTGLAAIWVSIAWVPYILDRFMVRGLMGTFANPSPDLPEQSAWAQRAKAAHKVGVELLVAFAPLAVLAMMKIPEDGYPGLLAMTFFWGLLAHYVIYVIGLPVLRTVAFLLASLSTLALGLRILGWI